MEGSRGGAMIEEDYDDTRFCDLTTPSPPVTRVGEINRYVDLLRRVT